MGLNLHLLLNFVIAGTFAAGSNLDQFRRTSRSAEFVEHIRTSRPSLLSGLKLIPVSPWPPGPADLATLKRIIWHSRRGQVVGSDSLRLSPPVTGRAGPGGAAAAAARR